LLGRVGKKFFLLLPLLFAVAVFISVSQQYFEQYSAALRAEAAGDPAASVVLPNGREVGGDFVTFYNAAKIYRENPGRTYDLSLQLEQLKVRFENTPLKSPLLLPYVYPPPLTALFAWLSSGSLLQAYLSWVVILIVCAAVGIGLALLAAEAKPAPAAYAALLACGFGPLVLDSFGAGQTSGLGMLIVGGTLFLLARRYDFSAGLLLGLGSYKPPLFALIVCGLLLDRSIKVDRRIRIGLGFTISAAAFNLLGVFQLGPAGYLSYLEQTSHYRYGEVFGPGLNLPVYLGVGGYSLVCRIFDPTTLTSKMIYAALVLLALGLYRRLSSRSATRADSASLTLRFSLLAALSLWLSPQMNSYDLAVALIPIAVLLVEIWDRPKSGQTCFFILATAAVYLEWLVRDQFGTEQHFIPTAGAFLLWIMAITLFVGTLAPATRARLSAK
jgi:hypothetical protein